MKTVKYGKVSSVLIALVLVVTLIVNPVLAEMDNPAQVFKDVKPSDWFYPYVINLYDRGIVSGYGTSGEFRPANKVIREHAAKMICLSAELDHEGKDADFIDKDQINPTLISYIAALVEKGAIGGFPDGTFRPAANIQRGHACKMVVHAFDLEAGEGTVTFPDLPANDPLVAEAITILASNGIVSGYGSTGEFRPRNEITRAEMSKILCVTSAVASVQRAEAIRALEAIDEAEPYVAALPQDQTKADLEERLAALRAVLMDAGLTSVTVAGETAVPAGDDAAVYAVILPAGRGPGSLGEEDFEIILSNPDGASRSDLETVDGGYSWTFTVTAEDGVTEADYTIHVAIHVADAEWAATGEVGVVADSQDDPAGEIKLEYEMLHGGVRVPLAAGSAAWIRVKKDGGSWLDLAPGADTTLWFPMESDPGLFEFMVEMVDGARYRASLDWDPQIKEGVWEATGQEGEHQGIIYVEYKLLDGDGQVSLEQDDVKLIARLADDKWMALEPNTDPTLWFNKGHVTGDYEFFIVTCEDDLYRPVLSHVRPEYEVTFDADGGTPEPDMEQVPHGEKVTRPAAMTKEGYGLGGWYRDPGYVEAWNFDHDRVTGDLTLYARWTINQYRIFFDSAGGSPVATIEEEYGTELTAPQDPTRTGYDFISWDPPFPATMPAEDLTLVAQWEAIQYPIYYQNLHDGTNPDNPAVYTIEQAVSLLPASRTGHDFLGWYGQETGGYNITEIPVGSTGPVTLYARWAAKRYDVILNAYGGTPYQQYLNVTYGREYGPLPSVSRTGYHDQGWYTQPEGGSLVKPSTIVTTPRNHTLWAHWEPVHFRVYYNANGGDTGFMEYQEFVYDEWQYLRPNSYTRTHYVFDSWNTKPDGSGDSYQDKEYVGNLADQDCYVHLYAQWQPMTSKVTFHGNGGVAPSPSSRVVTYGQPYGSLAYTYHEGSHGRAYRFFAWCTASSGGQPVHEGTIVDRSTNHTLYAQWMQDFIVTEATFQNRVKVHPADLSGIGTYYYKTDFNQGTWRGWDYGSHEFRVTGSNWPTNLSRLSFDGIFGDTLDISGSRNGSVSGRLRVEIRNKANPDLRTWFYIDVSNGVLNGVAKVKVTIP